jgi:hypothetical protein
MRETHDIYGEMKALSRQRIRLIWETAQLGGPLPDEEARLVEVMREHPEYADLWGRLDTLSDEQIRSPGASLSRRVARLRRSCGRACRSTKRSTALVPC